MFLFNVVWNEKNFVASSRFREYLGILRGGFYFEIPAGGQRSQVPTAQAR